MTARIRPARPSEASALGELARTTFCETFVEGFKMNYPPSDLSRFLETSYAPGAVRAWFAGRPEQVLVAEDVDGTLLAYAHGGLNTLPAPGAGREDGEVKRLYVARRAQGQGLGRRLLEDILEGLRGRRIFIGVWSGNEKALRLYAGYGFVPAGAYQFAVGDTLDDELILSRGPAEPSAA